MNYEFIISMKMPMPRMSWMSKLGLGRNCGLTRFPVVVLVNDKEIVLKTDDLNEVVDFLKKNR